MPESFDTPETVGGGDLSGEDRGDGSNSEMAGVGATQAATAAPPGTGERFPAPALIPLDTAQRGKGPYIWRFNLLHRLMHLLAMLTFYTLVLTGIPLRYADAPFSGPLIQLWGGVEGAGLIHRISAGIMVFYSVLFGIYLVLRFLKAEKKFELIRGYNAMIPNLQDAKDFFAQWKWYLTGRNRPQFGRYGYLEKLDFFGEVWGFFIIGGSGILLWFPEFWGQWLPGYWFNVATVLHGYEALIAAGFIFIVHFFNVHLRPDKFPLDAVMFHGRATLAYMEEEHPALLDEIDLDLDAPVSEKAVLDAIAPPPSNLQTILGAFFGFIALGIGILCIGLIAWAVAFG
jgi:cytochrome b subunit of formate dehydrogenase